MTLLVGHPVQNEEPDGEDAPAGEWVTGRRPMQHNDTPGKERPGTTDSQDSARIEAYADPDTDAFVLASSASADAELRTQQPVDLEAHR